MSEPHPPGRVRLPSYSIFEAAERGEVAIGGCVIEADNPRWSCPVCEHRWYPPELRRRPKSNGWTNRSIPAPQHSTSRARDRVLARPILAPISPPDISVMRQAVSLDWWVTRAAALTAAYGDGKNSIDGVPQLPHPA